MSKFHKEKTDRDKIHTAFRSVKLDGVTEMAGPTTIQHQDASRDVTERPELTGMTSFRSWM